MGYPEILPVHQGRAAERIVLSRILRPGDISVSNTHFDTTRANVEIAGAEAIDLVERQETADDCSSSECPAFGGNIDVFELEALLRSEQGDRVRCVVITITNNAAGGQPVSLENVRQARKVCDLFGVPLMLDASRFAENAYLVTQRDPSRQFHSATEVAKEIFDLADGCWASLKKDGIGNIGGVIALNDSSLANRCRDELIATEGFATYGGLAGRDLAALAVGLREVLDPHYLKYRADSARWFAEELIKAGAPVLEPTGCHAVYLDAARALPHIAPHELPGSSLTCALFLDGGVRGCDLGTLAFGRINPHGGSDIPAPRELVRLAIPRRVYTSNHLGYVASVVAQVMDKTHTLHGYQIVDQEPTLRHFTAQMRPIAT
jgi:tryptophanase